MVLNQRLHVFANNRVTRGVNFESFSVKQHDTQMNAMGSCGHLLDVYIGQGMQDSIVTQSIQRYDLQQHGGIRLTCCFGCFGWEY